LTFLIISTIIGLNQSNEIFHTGQQLIQTQGSNLIIPFALLATLVVTIHEFGHAFTLKNYNGIVPEIGLLIIMFMPAAYTNTTDSYCLPRFKRVLVVGAGLLVQFIITAIALLLWNISTTGTWLHTGSYLLMTAALFTVALNLNPLAKFDGYYLASAITGINNLRSRSFNLYKNLLTTKPIQETEKDAIILATYAPLSLLYIWLVFGFLIINITQWVLTNLPTTTLILFTLWAIYYYLPRKK
jgi:putative peptide zinc metalloprotease protein